MTYLPMVEYLEWARNASGPTVHHDDDAAITPGLAELEAELDRTKRRLAALETRLKAKKS